MNLSKHEQRVLHVLAQGGAIHADRLPNGKIDAVRCMTRDGYILSDCTLAIFARLRKRRLIRSVNALPYRVTRLGLNAVRAQLDNR